MKTPREPAEYERSHQNTLYWLMLDGNYGNALYIAAASNAQNTIEGLLELDKANTISSLWYGNAIVAASVSNFAPCVEMILQHPHFKITSEWSGTALRTAALHDSKDCMLAILSHATIGKLDIADSEYGRALVIAASNNNLQTIETLLTSSYADLVTGAQYAEALGSACSAGYRNAISVLLENVPMHCQSNESYEKALEICCSNNNAECAGLLLSKFQFSTSCLGAAVSGASSYESPETLLILLDRLQPHAGAEWFTAATNKAFWQACLHERNSIVQLLVSRGVPFFPSDACHRVFLRTAVDEASPEVMKLLLDKQADAVIRGVWRDELVFITASHGHDELLKMLLVDGGNAGSVRAEWSAINSAAEKQYKDCVDVLIEHGADVNTKQGGFDKIPLHWAAEKGNLAMVESLLKAGSIANSLDEFHQTPLHYAAEQGYTEIVRLLIPVTDVSFVDTKGRTALTCAQNGQHEEVVRLLNEL